MKKVLVLMMTCILALSLVACGGVPKEKLAEVDTLITNLEVLVQDASKEVEKTNNTGYDDVQAYYNETSQVVKELSGIFAEIKTLWAENKKSMDETAVDEAITELKALEKQAQDLKKTAIDEVAAIGGAIAENEKKPNSIDVPVEIVNNTGVEIHALAMSPANSEDWGENLLTEVIANGESGMGQLTFSADTLVWDLLVEDASGNQLSFMGLDFSEADVNGAKLSLAVTASGEYEAKFVN